MKKSVVLLLLSIIVSSLYAKQDPMYTHYMYNTLGVNPAYAGSRDAWTATLLHRSQWVGMDGAPVTQTLTAHGPVSGDAVNLGIAITNDKQGPLTNPSAYIDYAYRFKVGKKSKLSLGVNAGGEYLSADLSNSANVDPNDPLLADIDGDIKFNFGVGAYFSMDRFYAGVSIPQILENNYSVEGTHLVNDARNYYFIAGAKIDLSKDFALKPTTFVKATADMPLQLDLTLCGMYKDRFLLGAMYRTGDAVGGLIGVNIIQQLYLGYSLDWSIHSEISQNTYASHEVVLRYDFASDKQKVKRISSPRKFYF